MSSEEDIRPSFDLIIEARRERVIEVLERELGRVSSHVHAQMAGPHLQLLIDAKERRYWSPTLTVSFEEEGSVTRIRGRYGPHASVWTMFMSIHIFWVFCGVAGAMHAIGGWMMGHTPWGLLALPIALVLMGITYFVMRIGHQLGEPQVKILALTFDHMLAVGERAKD